MRRPYIKRVDRLVAMAVLGAVLLTWAVLVSLDAFRVFVSELDDVGTGDYTLTKAAVYVLMTVPRRVYEMFGYAALIGSLLGLGGLANSGELTALRAAGLSKLRISASVALGLGVLTMLVAVLGETLAPVGDRRAQALLLSAKSSDVALARGGTLWARDGDNVIGARRARGRAARGRPLRRACLRVRGGRAPDRAVGRRRGPPCGGSLDAARGAPHRVRRALGDNPRGGHPALAVQP